MAVVRRDGAREARHTGLRRARQGEVACKNSRHICRWKKHFDHFFTQTSITFSSLLGSLPNVVGVWTTSGLSLVANMSLIDQGTNEWGRLQFLV